VPRRDSNSGLPYSKPMRYCLSHASSNYGHGTGTGYLFWVNQIGKLLLHYNLQNPPPPPRTSLPDHLKSRHFGACSRVLYCLREKERPTRTPSPLPWPAMTKYGIPACILLTSPVSSCGAGRPKFRLHNAEGIAKKIGEIAV
jgi:hypothetical protein